MWTSHWRTLIGKDLRLHGPAIAMAMAGALTLIWAGTTLAPQGIGPRVSLVFNVNIFLTLLWSEWLVARERSKRTFTWLRTLPVDDRVLAGTKFVTSAGSSVLFWVVSTAMFARELWQPAGTGVTLLCVVLLFGGLGIAARLRWSWRFGQVAPLCILAVPVVWFIVFAGEGTARRDALIALWNAPWGRAAVAASLLLLYTVSIATTVSWLSRADTVDLVD
jgi:hypothetical protein